LAMVIAELAEANAESLTIRKFQQGQHLAPE
jgi:hypothetical protein